MMNVGELEARKLQVLDLQTRLALKEAVEAKMRAEALQQRLAEEHDRLCLSVGADPKMAEINFETGEVRIP